MRGSLEKFAGEARDRLAILRNALAEVRSGEADAADTVRRMARSVARTAGDLGLEDVRQAAVALADAGIGEEMQDRSSTLLHLVYAEGRGGGAVRLLVIDDEPTSALLLKTLVTAPDREVHVVGTAGEAEAFLAEHSVDLILLDLLLPDADGRDFLVRLKEDPATADTPVIVLSGLPASRAAAECKALGAQDYVEKPRLTTDAPATVARHLGDAEPVSPSAPRRILFVEDDPVTATLVRFRLEKDGFAVDHHDNGSDALTAARAGRYVLAILDVKLAGMDGFELLQRIRELEHLRRVPVIMLTGMGRDSDIVRGFELGSSDYMLKPFSPAELMARVHRLLES